MVAVKGSKQYSMRVVPYRPWYRAGIACLLFVLIGGAGWFTYQYGLQRGLALRTEVVEERSKLNRQLEEREKLVESMRQEIADLKVGGEVDSRATEEVRQTVESLQGQIAELREEIRFYKGVMLPNVEEKGLRIERFNLTDTGEPDRFGYNLLLAQVVDEHDFIQGTVEIEIVGTELDGNEKSLSLDQIDAESGDSLGFKFRYFQNIEGVFTIPRGFEPVEVVVSAQSSGSSNDTREKSFQWQPSGG